MAARPGLQGRAVKKPPAAPALADPAGLEASPANPAVRSGRNLGGLCLPAMTRDFLQKQKRVFFLSSFSSIICNTKVVILGSQIGKWKCENGTGSTASCRGAGRSCRK